MNIWIGRAVFIHGCIEDLFGLFGNEKLCWLIHHPCSKFWWTSQQRKEMWRQFDCFSITLEAQFTPKCSCLADRCSIDLSKTLLFFLKSHTEHLEIAHYQHLRAKYRHKIGVNFFLEFTQPQKTNSRKIMQLASHGCCPPSNKWYVQRTTVAIFFCLFLSVHVTFGIQQWYPFLPIGGSTAEWRALRETLHQDLSDLFLAFLSNFSLSDMIIKLPCLGIVWAS